MARTGHKQGAPHPSVGFTGSHSGHNILCVAYRKERYSDHCCSYCISQTSSTLQGSMQFTFNFNDLQNLRQPAY